ncbi:MAG: alpha/beta hydrolase [Dermatophilaceae bacterium]
MKPATTTLTTPDGVDLFLYSWEPDDGQPKAIVQIVHGMAEHAARYEHVARALTDAGYAVYANDHRGHGHTAGSVEAMGHLADDDGWHKTTEDLLLVLRRATAEHPGIPVFMVGHSMGAILARTFAITHGRELDGLVLSAAGGDPGLLGRVAQVIALVERQVRGRRTRSPMLDKLTFGSFNSSFKPNRTDFDWLSRDEAQVDKYIADPWCGNISTTGFFVDLLSGVYFVNSSDNIARVPKDLPIYLVAGALDPVGDKTAGVRQTAEQYRHAGVTDVTEQYYEGAHHEIFNETNRDEVIADVVSWLDAHLTASDSQPESSST